MIAQAGPKESIACRSEPAPRSLVAALCFRVDLWRSYPPPRYRLGLNERASKAKVVRCYCRTYKDIHGPHIAAFSRLYSKHIYHVFRSQHNFSDSGCLNQETSRSCSRSQSLHSCVTETPRLSYNLHLRVRSQHTILRLETDSPTLESSTTARSSVRTKLPRQP